MIGSLLTALGQSASIGFRGKRPLCPCPPGDRRLTDALRARWWASGEGRMLRKPTVGVVAAPRVLAGADRAGDGGRVARQPHPDVCAGPRPAGAFYHGGPAVLGHRGNRAPGRPVALTAGDARHPDNLRPRRFRLTASSAGSGRPGRASHSSWGDGTLAFGAPVAAPVAGLTPAGDRNVHVAPGKSVRALQPRGRAGMAASPLRHPPQPLHLPRPAAELVPTRENVAHQQSPTCLQRLAAGFLADRKRDRTTPLGRTSIEPVVWGSAILVP